MFSNGGVVTPKSSPSRRGRSPKASNSPAGSMQGHTTAHTTATIKPTPTFTSSLGIPVEGAIPIGPDGNPQRPLQPDNPAVEVISEPKRAARKSKTDALAALNSRPRSPSASFRELDDLTSKYQDGPSIPVNPALDLSSVRTSTPRTSTIKRPPRPFEITDCPEYYPSMEEFRDPMVYINSISDEAKNYGICKIIPPEGWSMPYVTDTETFRFKTRLQRLNSIEASSRAKLNFLEQLYRYHKQQGNPRVSVPTINHKPLDLWLLRKEVQRLGGYDAVTKAKKWPDLGRLLGYGGIPGLSTQIKNSYTRVILPYEHFCERVRNSSALAPLLARDVSRSLPSSPTKSPSKGPDVSANDIGSEPSSPLTTTSSPLSDVPDDNESSSPDRSRRNLRSDDKGNEIFPILPSPVFYDSKTKSDSRGTPEQTCEVCHKKNRGEEMLLCDGCDCGFHMFCLDPPLASIPKDQWFCYTCLAGTGGDYGFDEGEEHSLSSFQARDKEFRRLWFDSHPPKPSDSMEEFPEYMVSQIGDTTLTEYDVEDEFWRLVQSQYETVEVEYGADVHSTTHGSAMPTMETHPLDPYSKDPWNLNNVAIIPESLLRFIKSDISGMTVPWTYVGMTFSTFCWHNEDHYTHSINYMHWGEPKTWYGVPGEDAEKFEAAIKYEAPDLFEAQPDLLFQLVTLMNPKRVREAGVRVYGCNQRAGEFVITFPKAYHAGFNHGLNFNEAVNFALPGWLSTGLDCVKRYREHRKLPVFSHDELLITITQQPVSIKTAMWLSDSLQEMVNREMEDRKTARDTGMPEILVAEDRPEEQYQCTVCKVFCYLSQVTCPCSAKVVCVEHIDLLCEKSSQDHLSLRLRFSDLELLDMQRKFHERASSPNQWKSKLETLLAGTARPQFRSLRALIAEGDRMGVQCVELTVLHKCVEKANAWVRLANDSFLQRKQSRNRSRKSGRFQGGIEGEEIDPGPPLEHDLTELQSLLKTSEDLGFDSPEINALRNLGDRAQTVKDQILRLLTVPLEEQDENFMRTAEIVLVDADGLNVHLEETVQLKRIVGREALRIDLESVVNNKNKKLTLDQVRRYLTKGQACDLPPDNPNMLALETKLQEGLDWEENAQKLLHKPIKTIDELLDMLNLNASVPRDPAIYERISSAHDKALDFDKQADQWLTLIPGATKPRLVEVHRLIARAEKEFDIPGIQELKRAAGIAQDLEARCEQVLKNIFDHQDGEDVFLIFQEWKKYAVDHLAMFMLPMFSKLEHQLGDHAAWLKELPWWCPDHSLPHTEIILEEVLAFTGPEDDCPPTDEFYTCICTKPVRPPSGDNSDAVQCDHCLARFHGVCARSGGSCPFCDHNHWNGTIQKSRNWHSYYFPSILMKAPELTKHYSAHWRHLQVIIHRLDRLSNVIGTFLMFASQLVNQKHELLPQTRHFMRKLYKLQFAVSPSPEVSFGLDLSAIHRILAHVPPAPPTRTMKKKRRSAFTFGQDVDNDWSDGTRCICRGRTNYLLNYLTVNCRTCGRLYHAGCVFFNRGAPQVRPYSCPLCCLRKGQVYPCSDVRVKPNSTSEEARDRDRYVDTKRMLDTRSRGLIFVNLSPPQNPTLFVELFSYDPDEEYSENGLPPRPHSGPSTPYPPPHPWSGGSSRDSRPPPPPPPGGHSHRRQPPSEPRLSTSREARPMIESDPEYERTDVQSMYPPAPHSPAASGSGYPPYDPRKKRKVDDLQKFHGDVALYGAHGDHAGNRRWNDRPPKPSSSSSVPPRPMHPDVIVRHPPRHSTREPSLERHPSSSRAPRPDSAYHSPNLVDMDSPYAEVVDRRLDDSPYSRGSKRKALDDDPIYHRPGPPEQAHRRMSGSNGHSSSSPGRSTGGPTLSPSLAMLMSPVNQRPSPPPVSRRGYGGDSPVLAPATVVRPVSGGSASSVPLPPIQSSVPRNNHQPLAPGRVTTLPPITMMIGKPT